MYKQSPSRTNRSKGIKVKHVLQICLLLAVCFWLIYQVKHSQDKRREFDAKDERVVDKVQTEGKIQRLGRKDLPTVTEIATDSEKHVEEEDDKEAEEVDNKHEEEEEEENKPEEDENKHEEEESERDGRIEEKEEGIGGGDDEIDENDLEKREHEQEQEHGEEQVDEDKDREDDEANTEQNHAENEDSGKEKHVEDEENEDPGKENHVDDEEIEDAGKENVKDEENKDPGKEKHVEDEENEDAGKEGVTELEEARDVDTEDHNERDTASGDQDHDGDSTDTHEAQEELYKADDASSEVAHGVQTFNSETENATTGHANDMFGKINFGQENETTSVNAGTLLKTEEQPLVDKDGVSNGTVIEQKTQETNLTRSDDGSLQNSTSATLPNSQPEINSNSTSLVEEHLALTNGTQTTGNKDPNLLGTVLKEDNKSKLSTDENSLPEASAKSNKTENAYTNGGESLSSNNTTVASSQKPNDTDNTEAAKKSSAGDESQGEKSENKGEVGSDESSSSHLDAENAGAIQHDPIDTSDSTITEEEKESRVDLNKLPEIKTEVKNSEEEAVAE